MNKLIILIILLFTKSIFSQNTLIVDYTHFLHMKSLPSPTTINARLTSNFLYSNYEMDFAGNINFKDEEPGLVSGSVQSIKTNVNPKIFKNFKEKKIYSIERVSMKPFFVKDSMSIFEWKITSNKKTILGYNCQQANLNYRGRNYTAYFTSRIPYNTGPWKFCGLPGLILEIKSDDGVFKLEANKIEIIKSETSIINPFDTIKLKPIKWEAYINEYQKKHIELSTFRGENGSTISLPLKKIETLISENSPYIQQ